MSGCPNSHCQRVKRWFPAVVLAALVSACAHTPSVAPPHINEVEINRGLPGERPCHHEESLLNLLGLLDDFNHADTRGRATIYEQVSTTAVLEPTTANRLALALLKATPGHHGYNLESAQTLLNTALDDTNALSTGVTRFARIYVRSVTEQRKLAQRNRQLRAELADAKSKLDALTEIEREVDLPAPDTEEPRTGRQLPPASLNSNSKRESGHAEPQKNSASR
jgi:hypothetical protein